MPRRPLRLPLGLLPLVLLLLLAVQRLARVAFPTQRHALVVSTPIPESMLTARLHEGVYRTPRHYYVIPDDLDRHKHWLSYTITGNAQHDNAMLRAAAKRLRHGQAHPAERVDVRIRFASGAHYAQVVAALDMMLQVGQRKYALDMYRPEPTLYVFVTFNGL